MQLQSYEKGDEALILNPSLSDIENPDLKEFFSFWLELHNKSGKPRREDFSPKNLIKFLPNITLIDYEQDRGRFRHRVMGTKVVEACGVDNTNKYFDEIENAKYAIERLSWSVENKKPYYVRSNSMQWVINDFYGYDAIGCPLFDDNDKVNMIIFLFAFRSKYRDAIGL